MISIKASGATNLNWVQTGDLETQLKEDSSSDKSFASLKWAKKRGSIATGSAPEGTWTLKRTGFLHPKVTVREAGIDIDIATYKLNWSGYGTLVIPSEGQEVYQFKRFSVWKPDWILSTSGGETVLRISPEMSWKEIGASVQFESTALTKNAKELALLAIITWYVLILMMYDDAGDSTAAFVGAIVAATA